MDSGIGTHALLLLFSGMVVGAFLAYSITIIYRLGFTTYLEIIGQMGKAIANVVTTFTSSVIGLLAASAQTSDTDKAGNTTVQGGILNSRTGKLDDGTDPAGWYEKD